MGKVRDWMNNNSAVVTVAAVVLLLVALSAIIWQNSGSNRGGGRIENIYFYDMGSGQLFSGKASGIPPITAESGGEGVRAYVYGCGDCSETNRYIAYLEKNTPEAKAAMEKMQNPDANNPEGQAPEEYDPMITQGVLVRAVEGGQWVPMYSEMGQKITGALEGKCAAGTRLVPCLPGR